MYVTFHCDMSAWNDNFLCLLVASDLLLLIFYRLVNEISLFFIQKVLWYLYINLDVFIYESEQRMKYLLYGPKYLALLNSWDLCELLQVYFFFGGLVLFVYFWVPGWSCWSLMFLCVLRISFIFCIPLSYYFINVRFDLISLTEGK